MITEIVGTFVLRLRRHGHLRRQADGGRRASAACSSACWCSSIGLSLGGPTGYAINPARDLGAADRARAPADPGQGRLGLGLRLDPGGRTADRRRRSPPARLARSTQGERMTMKKLINDPDAVVREALEGMEAGPRRPPPRVLRPGDGRARRRARPGQGRDHLRRRLGPRADARRVRRARACSTRRARARCSPRRRRTRCSRRPRPSTAAPASCTSSRTTPATC